LPAAASKAASFTVNETDEFSYNIVKDPVHAANLQATLLNQFGIEPRSVHLQIPGSHQKLTASRQPRSSRQFLA